MKQLYQITLSYLCAGIIVEDDYVIKAAPILKWMVGKTIYKVEFWVYKKNGTINNVLLRTQTRAGFSCY